MSHRFIVPGIRLSALDGALKQHTIPSFIYPSACISIHASNLLLMSAYRSHKGIIQRASAEDSTQRAAHPFNGRCHQSPPPRALGGPLITERQSSDELPGNCCCCCYQALLSALSPMQ